MWHMQSVDRKEVTYTDSSGKHRSLGKAVVNASMQGLARYNCSNELTNSMSRGKKKKNQRKKNNKIPTLSISSSPSSSFLFHILGSHAIIFKSLRQAWQKARQVPYNSLNNVFGSVWVYWTKVCAIVVTVRKKATEHSRIYISWKDKIWLNWSRKISRQTNGYK